MISRQSLFGAFLVALALWAGSLNPAAVRAAQVNTSTYAKDSAGQPVPDPLTEVKTGTGSPPVTSSIRRDSTKAHAQAWASASLSGTTVTKSASGNGWLDAGSPTLDAKGETWSSSASGSLYIVNGPIGQSTFQLRIPAAPTLNLAQTGYNAAQAQPGDFPLPNLQTLSRTQIPAGDNTTFFDFTYHLTVSVVQGITTSQIFDGGLTITANGTIIPVGDSTTPFLITNVDALGSIGAQFVDNFVFPKSATVNNNIPFDLTFVTSMQMGDGNSTAGGTFPALGSMTTQVGGGGSFTAFFEMVNPPAGVSLQPVVPEPAGLVSAAIGGLLAIAAVYRRKK